jgi:hypothetical protein
LLSWRVAGRPELENRRCVRRCVFKQTCLKAVGEGGGHANGHAIFLRKETLLIEIKGLNGKGGDC